MPMGPPGKRPRSLAAEGRSNGGPATPDPEHAPGGGAPPTLTPHPFAANFNDHFETSIEALRDLLPVVQELRALTRPSSPEQFVLYDPYYCDGTVVGLWRALGLPHVLHANRDFYADIAQDTVPGPYDLLVTNPPFSGTHLPRLLAFLAQARGEAGGNQQRPWAFLAPDYIAAKPWYRAWVRAHFEVAGEDRGPGDAANAPRRTRISQLEPPTFLKAPQADVRVDGAHKDGADVACNTVLGRSALSKLGPEPFYIVPKVCYDFRHPVNAGHEHSHFKSMWYVWMGSRTSEIIRASKIALIKVATSGSTAAVVHGLQALDKGQYVPATEKRLNPRQRRRIHSKRG